MLESEIHTSYPSTPQRLSGGVLSAIGAHLLGLRPNPYALILLTVVVLEALLSARLWLLLTSATKVGPVAILMDITDRMVTPFRTFDIVTTSNTGIFEFATLAAMEAVLVTALASIVTIFIGGNLIRGAAYVASRTIYSAPSRDI